MSLSSPRARRVIRASSGISLRRIPGDIRCAFCLSAEAAVRLAGWGTVLVSPPSVPAGLGGAEMGKEVVFELQVEGFEDPILGRVSFDRFEDPILGLEKLRVFETPVFCKVRFKGRPEVLEVRTGPGDVRR